LGDLAAVETCVGAFVPFCWAGRVRGDFGGKYSGCFCFA